MTLPAFDPDLVQLSDEEMEAVKRFYNAILKGQVAFSDGFQLDDLFQVPEIAGDGNAVIQWVIKGRPGDPADDEAVAKRIAALGFGLVRASGLFDKLGSDDSPEPLASGADLNMGGASEPPSGGAAPPAGGAPEGGQPQ